jgi:aromatic-amino-acid transaminase
MSPTAVTTPLSHLPAARAERGGDDPIFALNAEATARRARGESILNATVGVLLRDDGTLAVLPSAARAVREVPAREWAAYAPIAGPPPFLDAVVRDLCGSRQDLAAESIAVATPGGTGALRHAIATFLEPGQALLTTSFHWGPYATIADENERRVETFPMFDARDELDVGAFDAALGRQVARQGRALVVWNDPCHNPTGYSMSAADWERVAEVVGRHARRAPVTVLLDAAYSAYGPGGRMDGPIAALAPLGDRVLLATAWSASKTFTHYGLRVGALVVRVPDATERRRTASCLTYACRGTWSNANRGGMHAVTRLLTEPGLRDAVRAEREELVRLLRERVDAFNAAARAAGLRHPRYDGGFFTTVFADDGDAVARAMRGQGVYAVPQDGGVRLALCSTSLAEVPRLVEALATCGARRRA